MAGRRRDSNQNQNHHPDQADSVGKTGVSSGEEEDNTTLDIISDLPDEILTHIISLVPCIESASKTRLLSTRWLHLWNMNTVEHQHASIDSIETLLLGFVFSSVHYYPRKLLFHPDEGLYELVATMGANMNLHLDFSHGGDLDQRSSLPPTSFSLILLPDSCPNSESKFSIRSIRLTSVDRLSSDMVSSLLYNSCFHTIETIEITNSRALSDTCVIYSRKLRQLSIIDCNINSIDIIAKYLTSFRYRGKSPKMLLKISGCFKDVMLDFRQGPNPVYDPSKHQCCLLLSSLKEAQYISICQWTFEIMIGLRSNTVPLFKYLKELWWIDSSMEDEKINSLITFLESCPFLEKLFVTIDPKCYSRPSKGIDMSHRSRKGPLRNLKMVKMDGFEHEEDELLLAYHIFNIAEKEPAVVATSADSCTRRLVKVHPNRRLFVEETDSEMLNNKHMHMCI